LGFVYLTYFHGNGLLWSPGNNIFPPDEQPQLY